jgi:hypothetical protein
MCTYEGRVRGIWTHSSNSRAGLVSTAVKIENGRMMLSEFMGGTL